MGVLRSMFPDLLIPDPDDVTASTWSTDPWTKGAYSYVTHLGNGVPGLVSPQKGHTVVTLWLHCCYTVVTPFLHFCYTPALVNKCCYTVVKLLLNCG
jgi:hypothetical protein